MFPKTPLRDIFTAAPEYEDEEEMQLPIVDHVREENALVLRQKGLKNETILLLTISREIHTWETNTPICLCYDAIISTNIDMKEKESLRYSF